MINRNIYEFFTFNTVFVRIGCNLYNKEENIFFFFTSIIKIKENLFIEKPYFRRIITNLSTYK